MVCTPNGSPISAVIAELTMQIFENKALINPPASSAFFWKRYADDIITALPFAEIANFTDHLNLLDNNIKFTVEKEENNCILFLNMLISHNNVGETNFNVYRKPTYSGKY